MADATLQHDAVHAVPGDYEAPLFGAYSKKVGMWLFLASDSLTFGALLFAFSYNRIYTAWPTPFHVQSIINATIMTACLLSSSLTMVMGVFAAQRGDGRGPATGCWPPWRSARRSSCCTAWSGAS